VQRYKAWEAGDRCGYFAEVHLVARTEAGPTRVLVSLRLPWLWIVGGAGDPESHDAAREQLQDVLAEVDWTDLGDEIHRAAEEARRAAALFDF
jgi:hypothetical protein